MNDYSRKSLVNLGIFILLAFLIASFVVLCTTVANGEKVPFWSVPMPVVTIVYGVVMFFKKYFILK